MADFDPEAQAVKELDKAGKLGEMNTHEASAKDEGTDGIGIALFFACKHLAENGKRISGRVRNNPGERGCNFDVLPATFGLHCMRVFPLLKLDLRGYGFDGDAELGAKIKRAKSHLAIKFTQLRDVAFGMGHRFAFAAFNGISQTAAGTEEHGRGVEISAQLLLTKLSDFFG